MNTCLTYLDWELGNNLDGNREVDSSLNSAHIHTKEIAVPSTDDAKTIRAYLRPDPRAHKQIAAGAFLNLIFVYLVAVGRVAPGVNGTTQAWLLLAPAGLMALITEQQRHYYAAAIRRQRAVLWIYLGICILFLITALFSLPHAPKTSEHWGMKATVAAWALASFSLALTLLTLPLGAGYEWITKRLVRMEIKLAVPSDGSSKYSWWASYERDLLSWGKRIWWTAIMVTVLVVSGLAITNWGRALKAGHVLHLEPAALHHASHKHILGLLSVTSWPAKDCTHCNLELRFIPTHDRSAK
jgi:hypothetical protein